MGDYYGSDDSFEDKDMAPLRSFAGFPSITSYLTSLRSVVFGRTATSTSQASHESQLVVTIGNPSCDLDSFISAVVLSYFYNCKSGSSSSTASESTTYVPLLNLPGISSRELWRLRPEFGVALKSAVEGTPNQAPTSSRPRSKDESKENRALLANLVTLADIEREEGAVTSLREAFRPSRADSATDASQAGSKQTVILVDHNAPAVPGITDEDLKARLDVRGCVDHHIEESYVPSDAEPRIVTTGIGSCTSLVVQHLKNSNLWPADENSVTDDPERKKGLQQMARLSLASILIDTANLTATGDRNSLTDREAVRFLEQRVGDGFSRDVMYELVFKAKSDSLDLLHMSEIFARDYKEWTEEVKDKDVIIGISGLFRGLDWLVDHAGGHEKFVKEFIKYAQQGERGLGIFSLLTRRGDRKEVVVVSLSEEGKRGIQSFEKLAGELQLQEWSEDQDLIQTLDKALTHIGGGCCRIWWMGDTSKSRKQVGPLLRKAVHV